MIRLVTDFTLPDKECVELLKINLNRLCYPEISLFWIQNDGDAYISMLDGDMVIYSASPDYDELKEFISMISPRSVFTDKATADRLSLSVCDTVNVMKKISTETYGFTSDSLSSSEIYDIFKKSGFALPKYDDFAVDYCHRINNGYAENFCIRNVGCAVSFSDGKTSAVFGIASLQKGMGSHILKGILAKNIGKTVFAVCNNELMQFYLKNGFEFSYNAVYRVK